MISMTIKDTTKEKTYSLLEVPLTEAQITGSSEIETLDGNISLYTTYQKRRWTHKWSYMSKEEYEELEGFYKRQHSLLRFPELTISHLGVTNVPVVMSLSSRKVVNSCGMVQGVEVNFRETRHMASGG